MSPEKADKLLDILVNNTSKGLTKEELEKKNYKKELANLYEESDKSPEAEAFRKFIKEHEISFLGGNNSKNFKITQLSDQSEFVLKIDYRFGMPRNVEAHLREKLSDKFIPIHAERQATCIDHATGDTITRGIHVTEYSGGGSVYDHRQQLTRVSDLIRYSGEIFEQMAGSMLDIQDAGCMFPDAKITNWLIDDIDQLQLSDTKTFIFTDKNGKYHLGLPGNEYGAFLDSNNYRPPEVNGLITDPSETILDADAVHAYILGVNLYIYATNSMGKGNNGAKFDFDFQLFNSEPHGPAFKELVVGLVNPDPAKRMPVREALDRLFMINNPEFKDVFTQLKTLNFGKDDKMMNQYIRDKQELINITYGKEARQKILEDLQNTVSALETGPVQQVRSEISKFRKEAADLFAVGKNAKAERIENAMSKLSIEERVHFFDSTKSKEVLKELASHRHWGKGGKVYLTENEIDTDKAATSFKDFKAKFQDQMKPRKPKEEEPTEREEHRKSIEI